MITFVSYLIATVFTIAGCAMLFLPVNTLLRIDRKLGYQLYVRAPNQEIGLQRARWYYRLVGLAFVIVPWLILGGAWWLR